MNRHRTSSDPVDLHKGRVARPAHSLVSMTRRTVTDYDLVVVGGTAGGISAAITMQRAGLGAVRIVDERHSVAFPELVGPYELDVGYGETVEAIDDDGEGLVVSSGKRSYRARACLIAHRQLIPDWDPLPGPAYGGPGVHVDVLPDHLDSSDVLIVGYTDHAVELTVQAANEGARVVLAAGGLDPEQLSPVANLMLRRLEHDRRATLLLQSTPQQIVEVGGCPMVYFGERRTPDLQFDHVVFASHRRTSRPADLGASDSAIRSGRVWFQGMPSESGVANSAPGWKVTGDLAAAWFPDLELTPLVPTHRRPAPGAVDRLQEEHYNATVTHFEPTHSDLWVLRVKPDHGGSSFVPGQYASLGLGYWEERIDGVLEHDIEKRWGKLVRRSYSISSRIFDPHGYLADEGGLDELEFYIVLVPATGSTVPGLTPRLALKKPGDRIYLGPKVAGRYTLAPVTDPASTVLFLATGTGEAPHNAMVVELLRKGHYGPIVSVVSVRERADLGYREKHESLAERYVNYRYLPLPTREPDVPKRYIQDLLRDGDLQDQGISLDPDDTHVFLCGNPAMIGLPEDGEFPHPTGVVEILSERGFRLDRRKEAGNIHVEEYW